jgi:small subunit ribosomal protein S17
MTGRQKTRIGTVVSNKMQKTVLVAVETMKRHRLYKKTLRRTKRFKAHDEGNSCEIGDLVRIVETRPLSRDKRWRVAEVLARHEVAEVAPREIGEEIIAEVVVKARPEETAEQAVPVPEAPEEGVEAPAPAVPEAAEEAEAEAEAPVEEAPAAEEAEEATQPEAEVPVEEQAEDRSAEAVTEEEEQPEEPTEEGAEEDKGE